MYNTRFAYFQLFVNATVFAFGLQVMVVEQEFARILLIARVHQRSSTIRQIDIAFVHKLYLSVIGRRQRVERAIPHLLELHRHHQFARKDEHDKRAEHQLVGVEHNEVVFIQLLQESRVSDAENDQRFQDEHTEHAHNGDGDENVDGDDDAFGGLVNQIGVFQRIELADKDEEMNNLSRNEQNGNTKLIMIPSMLAESNENDLTEKSTAAISMSTMSNPLAAAMKLQNLNERLTSDADEEQQILQLINAKD
eukprot:CAMPEP_0197037518 /NCGR_PEP_ID=MMETSP1384-20130603/14708_1 /TAXON_ID=29189 /ORGANISM="Ammonia sp." /LENGTH=250 /DNA_ID=CAMNT_0042467831 /DNA_START=162 /DNA_END=912 /DNA_ORIENTATION=+